MLEQNESHDPQPQIIESRIVNVSAIFLRQEIMSIDGVKRYVLIPGLFPEQTVESVVAFEGESIEEMARRAYSDHWGMRITQRRVGTLREHDFSRRSFATEEYDAFTVYFDAHFLYKDEIGRRSKEEIDQLSASIDDRRIYMGVIVTKNGEARPFYEGDLIVDTSTLASGLQGGEAAHSRTQEELDRERDAFERDWATYGVGMDHE